MTRATWTPDAARRLYLALSELEHRAAMHTMRERHGCRDGALRDLTLDARVAMARALGVTLEEFDDRREEFDRMIKEAKS